MLGFPVLSNKLGVIQGCTSQSASIHTQRKKSKLARAYFKYEPSAKAYAAYFLRTVREARAERASGRKARKGGSDHEQAAQDANHAERVPDTIFIVGR
jgi:hypothetical protein